MEFFNKTGKVALGSRLRQFASVVTNDAEKIYELYGVDFAPKWFPVFFVLSQGEPKTVSEIAEEIGHSQPSVTKLVKEMVKSGIIQNNLKSTDKRKTMVGLSKKGELISVRVTKLCEDVEATIDKIIEDTAYNLWEALAEWETLFEQQSLYERVKEHKKECESAKVKIVEFEPQYQPVFKRLNEEWISQYFELEEADVKSLDHPYEYILNKGGKILVALYENTPVGVCALMVSTNSEYQYEMAKMAVSATSRGKNIGWLLGNAIIEKSKELGATKIYLESNTILKPAINLYYKLGFTKITKPLPAYKRGNIQMELIINKS